MRRRRVLLPVLQSGAGAGSAIMRAVIVTAIAGLLVFSCGNPFSRSEPPDPPTFSPGGDSFSSGVEVVLAASAAEASIWYSFDADAPRSEYLRYSEPIRLGSTRTITAFAVVDGVQFSRNAQATYEIQDGSAPTPGNGGAVAVGALTGSTVSLSWTGGTDNVSFPEDLEYRAFYSTSNNIGDAASAQANGTAPLDWATGIETVTVPELLAGTTYFFTVLLRDQSGLTAAYGVVSATTTADAEAPLVDDPNLSTGSVGLDRFDVTWTAARDGVTAQTGLQYRVVTSTADNIGGLDEALANGSVSLDWTTNVTTHQVSGLNQKTRYWVNVLVRDAAGNMSAYHSEDAFTEPDVTAPTPAGTISFYNVQFQSVSAAWPAATDNLTAQADLEYRVYASQSVQINTYEQAVAADSYDLADMVVDWTANLTSILASSGVNDGTTYNVNVFVRDSAGNIAAYTAGSVTTLPRNDIYIGGNGGDHFMLLNDVPFGGSPTATDFDIWNNVSFPSNTLYARTADMDQDGRPDFVLGRSGPNAGFSYRSTADWTSASTAFLFDASLPTSNSTAMALGNFVNTAFDGTARYPDFVVDQAGPLRLYPSNAGTPGSPIAQTDGEWANYETLVSSLAPGDFNGDGILDLVIGRGVGDARANAVFLGTSTGVFTSMTGTTVPLGAADQTRDVVVGQFSGPDENLDILVLNNGNDVLYLGRGDGLFDAFGDTFATGDSSGAAVGDIDGDGDLDIVFARPSASLLVYRNDGVVDANPANGTFSIHPSPPNPDGFQYDAVALADLDGDGDLDLVGTSSNYREVAIWTNNGAGSFTGISGLSPLSVAPLTPTDVLVAPFRP